MAQTVKNLPAMRETRVLSLSREDHLEDTVTQPTGESNGQRNMSGYSLASNANLDR